MESIKTGIPKGYEKTGTITNSVSGESGALVGELKKSLETALQENALLKNKVAELELKLAQYEQSKARSALAGAKMTDAIVNGPAEEEEEEEEEEGDEED